MTTQEFERVYRIFQDYKWTLNQLKYQLDMLHCSQEFYRWICTDLKMEIVNIEKQSEAILAVPYETAYLKIFDQAHRIEEETGKVNFAALFNPIHSLGMGADRPALIDLGGGLGFWSQQFLKTAEKDGILINPSHKIIIEKLAMMPSIFSLQHLPQYEYIKEYGVMEMKQLINDLAIRAEIQFHPVIILAANFFHLFTEDQACTILHQLEDLLTSSKKGMLCIFEPSKPNTKTSVFFGSDIQHQMQIMKGIDSCYADFVRFFLDTMSVQATVSHYEREGYEVWIARYNN